MADIFEQTSEVSADAIGDTLNAHRLAAFDRFEGDAECISTTTEQVGDGFKITTRYRAHPTS